MILKLIFFFKEGAERKVVKLMKHTMGLIKNQMDLIRNGSKTIEIRLNDVKRQAIKTGDVIAFTQVENPSIILEVNVGQITLFPNFKELYLSYSPIEVGSYAEDSIDKMLADTYTIYSPAVERKFGALAIEVSLI